MEPYSSSLPGGLWSAATSDQTHKRAHKSHTAICDACVFGSSGTCLEGALSFLITLCHKHSEKNSVYAFAVADWHTYERECSLHNYSICH